MPLFVFTYYKRGDWENQYFCLLNIVNIIVTNCNRKDVDGMQCYTIQYAYQKCRDAQEGSVITIRGEEPMVQLVVKVPREIKQWLEEEARKARRTTSDYVRLLLERTMDKQEGIK